MAKGRSCKYMSSVLFCGLQELRMSFGTGPNSTPSHLDYTLLKIKVLHWHLWFHEKPLTSIDLWIHKRFIRLFKCSLQCGKKWFFYDVTVKKPFETYIFKSVGKDTVRILLLPSIKKTFLNHTKLVFWSPSLSKLDFNWAARWSLSMTIWKVLKTTWKPAKDQLDHAWRRFKARKPV